MIVGFDSYSLDLSNKIEVSIQNNRTPSFFSGEYFSNTLGEVYRYKDGAYNLLYTLDDGVLVHISEEISVGYHMSENEGYHFICEVSKCNDKSERTILIDSTVFSNDQPVYSYSGTHYIKSSNKIVVFSRDAEDDSDFKLNVYTLDGELVGMTIIPAYIWSFNGNTNYWYNSTSGASNQADFKILTSSPTQYGVKIKEWIDTDKNFIEHSIYTISGENINDIFPNGLAAIAIGNPEINNKGKLIHKIILGRVTVSGSNKFDDFIWGEIERSVDGYRFIEDIKISKTPSGNEFFLIFQGVSALNPLITSDGLAHVGQYNLDFNRDSLEALSKNIYIGSSVELERLVYATYNGNYLMRKKDDYSLVAYIAPDPLQCNP